MKIGIDLSVLQSDHRFRGIGSVVVNFINNLESEDKKNNEFVFFLEPDDENMAFNSLDLSDLSFEIRHFDRATYVHFPGRLNLLPKVFYKIMGYIQYWVGDPRIQKIALVDIDRFIQFDQNRKLPRHARKHSALFLHDLIPYILESDYLWSYSTARRNGHSLKSALKFAFKRHQYAARIKINTRRARLMIANSQQTKNDFVTYLHANPKKIHVARLGVSPPAEVEGTPSFYDYRTTMWGTVKEKFHPEKKPFLLYIGGIDNRRKIIELIAAFNNLRARGVDLSLIMSGDTLQGIGDIKTPHVKKYLEENTSYIDDIHLLGFVDNTQRDWLYKHALVFVFPSVYEGFGLPVLEAMSHGSPVIAFNSGSVKEVARNTIVYANDAIGITASVEQLLHDPHFAKKQSDDGVNRANQFTWKKTKQHILKALES